MHGSLMAMANGQDSVIHNEWQVNTLTDQNYHPGANNEILCCLLLCHVKVLLYYQ